MLLMEADVARSINVVHSCSPLYEVIMYDCEDSLHVCAKLGDVQTRSAATRIRVAWASKLDRVATKADFLCSWPTDLFSLGRMLSGQMRSNRRCVREEVMRGRAIGDK